MIKNIVFDFGGVIVDIDRDKAVQAFIKLGLTDADSRLDKYHQTGIFQELEEGKLSADEFRKQLEQFSYISKFHILISYKLTIYIVMCFYQGTN